ncbi:M61 family metallopeptidase [Psychroflexus planctonicus]|uniref:Peptidase M61 n=1 Tax=Psychroflexus planctonicus TaxID=1526575 RepID=A0ABQ1SHG7_9FLAO|nr:peptidase M61 [Psychroflexus planctonicus]GGE38912.1 peptidase M61 [Psychroflexus planctonicus]
MKKIWISLSIITLLFGCKPTQQAEQDYVLAHLDLVNVENDRIKVEVDPGKISKDTLRFYIPKTVPGTYALNSYGQFSEDLVAYDYKGNTMNASRIDENTWEIYDATNFDKLSYYSNDTFDIEGEGEVFSPAGTNIEKGENFVLNLHGFVGYFEGKKEEAYQIEIKRPTQLVASTSLPITKQTEEESYVVDQFYTNRYFGVIDHPIMYAEPDMINFDISGMQVVLSVYSPNNVHSTADLKPAIEKMVNAQKNFLGEIDNTNVYAILLYLSDMEETDARGFGALEHHTSTVVVLPESMPIADLESTMTDVVSHEFFHIITPLNVHSEEVHYFDYNEPKMSKHLWMYEGVTEYFANLFQIHQGLISEDEFYQRINEKIETAKAFDDTMPFTVMSENILDEKYSPSYYNVYLKGALIGMALDIELRKLSEGKMGVLDLMKALIEEYGVDKPFEDDELFDVIVEKTYPEINDFFETYVAGSSPIPYEEYFKQVGIEMQEKETKTGYFIDGQTPFIDANPSTKEVFFRKGMPVNSTFAEMGIQPGDVIKKVNGTEYNLDNIYSLISASMAWTEGEDLSLVIERDSEKIEFTGTTTQPTTVKTSLQAMDLEETDERYQLRQAWLKN